MENLGLSLQITVLGMGLVFSAIILIWALIVVLVNLTEEREAPATAAPTAAPIAQTDQQHVARKKAAVIAVAVALAEAAEAEDIHAMVPLPGSTEISAWQVARRADQLRPKGKV